MPTDHTSVTLRGFAYQVRQLCCVTLPTKHESCGARAALPTGHIWLPTKSIALRGRNVRHHAARA